ncbi:CDP-diacylglycerol--serine O-phosphatidyltransferase [Aquicella lusitana]|uniref:CDP-diacylglycerol--serine O-phosphatidyltransferase n=1 Tax=Aquicella lusitana TaxID=254246 RepID=A0A370GYP6_9COXI|nr:CDP-diacylglycerol--serine O-phosphatidyltransferase [Aquicella lusitana]RDI48769.1 CDP-diacylglycerol--serine O-phosphatidyltransferase [Aquicella lusitana]VVC73197.1 Phosphatidylcholine synthase [Aquicella lusitana]
MKDKQELSGPEQSENITRGIYLLPNLLTTAALFAGFYSIVAAMKGHFETAAIAIFVAMIADGLDGRVARLTNTQTAFGAQYDSLSDMVAFGLAPSLVCFSWSLFYLGKLGWLAAFIYTAATALRLARFNTQVSDKRYFQGLPSPSAAGVLASLVWMVSGYEIDGTAIAFPVAALTIFVAALMVSQVRYSSFKHVDFKGRVPFFTVVIMVFIIAAVALEPPEVLFTVFMIYLVSGPVITLWQLRKMRKQRIAEHKDNKTK